MSKRLIIYRALLGLVLIPFARAQVERASLAGTVIDPSGAVLPGVVVRVTNEGTNTSLNLQTDAAGTYRAVNLTPGSYSVQAEKSGFQRFLTKGLVLQVAQEGRLDIQLQLGGLEQTIEVSAATPLLQTEGSTVGQVIDTKPIETLPLNGRNIVQLAVLAPGVTGLSYAQTGTINSGLRPDELRPGGTTLLANGARDSSNQLLLDGIDNTEMISQTFVVRPPVEGVQEFKAITNNAGAEYGRAGGAVLVTSTRSGANNVHGSAFEYVRNSAMDAKNFFDRGDLPIPQYQLNQFGGSIGGPIIRNKTFFFADYEGYREKQGQTKVITVPTAAAKAGNFAGVARNGVFDPATTTPVTSGGTTTYTRTRFPGDVIPSRRFDPLAVKIVTLYPDPQTSALVNNYIANPEKIGNLDRGDIRIDHQITPNQTLFSRYSIDNSDLHIPNTFDARIGGNEDSFAGPDTVRGHNGVIAYNRVFSPTLMAGYRFGFTKFRQFLLPERLTDPVWSQIPGRDTTDPFQPSAPIISPSGYVGLGNARSEPLIRREHMFENVADVSWQKGKHALKFGVDIRHRLISETASPPGQSAFGRFSFSAGFTNNPSSTGGTGDAIASILLGFPSSTVRDFFIPGTAHVRTNEFNYYARDEWRVTGKPTLNLGFHYESIRHSRRTTITGSTGTRSPQSSFWLVRMRAGQIRRRPAELCRDRQYRSRKIYFLNIYLRDSRVLDYLLKRPDWDGKTIVLTGGSMGGQQSLALAGLRPEKITAVLVCVPAGADTNGNLHGRKAGYPNWPSDNADAMKTALYFDTVNFASHIQAPVMAGMGFIDTISPPAGIWTALNQIRGPKEPLPLIESEHDNLTPQKGRACPARTREILDLMVKGGEFHPNRLDPLLTNESKEVPHEISVRRRSVLHGCGRALFPTASGALL